MEATVDKKETSEIKKTTITREVIEQVFLAASSRNQGIKLEISGNCGRNLNTEITLKNQRPELVNLLEDGRVGLRIDSHSYMTVDAMSGTKFKEWILVAARSISSKSHSYGNPTTGIQFMCCG